MDMPPRRLETGRDALDYLDALERSYGSARIAATRELDELFDRAVDRNHQIALLEVSAERRGEELSEVREQFAEYGLPAASDEARTWAQKQLDARERRRQVRREAILRERWVTPGETPQDETESERELRLEARSKGETEFRERLDLLGISFEPAFPPPEKLFTGFPKQLARRARSALRPGRPRRRRAHPERRGGARSSRDGPDDGSGLDEPPSAAQGAPDEDDGMADL
jgi:hypothetical protein